MFPKLWVSSCQALFAAAVFAEKPTSGCRTSPLPSLQLKPYSSYILDTFLYWSSLLMQILLLLSRGMRTSGKLVGKLLACPPKTPNLKQTRPPSPSNISYSSKGFFSHMKVSSGLSLSGDVTSKPCSTSKFRVLESPWTRLMVCGKWQQYHDNWMAAPPLHS